MSYLQKNIRLFKMNNQKISVIIPAYNEEKFIQKTLESIKNTAAHLPEIIVVVNGSEDKTFEISKRYATKVLNFTKAIGPSVARNEGAKIATGDVFVFLDADTEISNNTIQEVVANANHNIVGVCSAATIDEKADKKLRAKIFFAFKNFVHKTKLHKGSLALIFCSREVFLGINGFNKDMRIGELNDFIKRAIKAGAVYKFLDNCHVITSLRRYEKEGYLRMFLFWIKWKIARVFKTDKKVTDKYFK